MTSEVLSKVVSSSAGGGLQEDMTACCPWAGPEQRLLSPPLSLECMFCPVFLQWEPLHHCHSGASIRHLSLESLLRSSSSFSFCVCCLHILLNTVPGMILLKHTSDHVTSLLKTLQWIYISVRVKTQVLKWPIRCYMIHTLPPIWFFISHYPYSFLFPPSQSFIRSIYLHQPLL